MREGMMGWCGCWIEDGLCNVYVTYMLHTRQVFVYSCDNDKRKLTPLWKSVEKCSQRGLAMQIGRALLDLGGIM